jgi:hypothetical protein
MKNMRQIAFWIFLLLGGALLVSTATYNTGLPGSGAGVGRFSYWFRYTLEPHTNEVLDDGLRGLVTIEGRAPGRFLADGGRSPKYQEVNMEWMMFSGVLGGGTEGTCAVDLSKNQIVAGANRLPLERGSLRSLFGVEVNSDQSDQFLDDLQSKLEAAASGTMPRPRHHTYYFEELPTRGKLQHFALGFSVRSPVLVWGCIWLLLVITTITIKKANKSLVQTASAL